MNSTSNYTARIMVVDDSPMNLTLLEHFLHHNGYEVCLASQGEKAIQVAKDCQPDLILLDINMPRINGYQVCQYLKERDELKDIPVIFLSALDNTEDKVKALKVGGVDYITKPFNEEEVMARIEIHLKISGLQKQLEDKNTALEEEITRREKAEAELTARAITDPLTQVYNRRHFFELATKEILRAQRSEKAFGVIMIDLDHFKTINDNYGHLTGDQVLIRFAKICQANMRKYDILARYGGEEFVILLPDTSPKRAEAVAERLRRIIAETEMQLGAIKLTVTISLGVANFDKAMTLSLETMLDRADQALYNSKQTGRNRVTVWEKMTP